MARRRPRVQSFPVSETSSFGIDIGDRVSQVFWVDPTGERIREFRLQTTHDAFERVFRNRPPARIALEVSSHSPWMVGLLEALGHEVYAANPHRLKIISESACKTDRKDAETLARLVRADPALLNPVAHRSLRFRQHRAILLSRGMAVSTRTTLINHVRGSLKPFGVRLPRLYPETFAKKVVEHIPAGLSAALMPIVQLIHEVNKQIRAYDKALEALADTEYRIPFERLTQVHGVGPVTALLFILTLEDPKRFRRGRQLGAYLGLVPRKRQTSGTDPELSITKRGDTHLRTALIQAAHFMLGAHGIDTDLARFGQRLIERGATSEKPGRRHYRRAVIAVARKLAILLHRLWLSGETWDPLRNNPRESAA